MALGKAYGRRVRSDGEIQNRGNVKGTKLKAGTFIFAAGSLVLPFLLPLSPCLLYTGFDEFFMRGKDRVPSFYDGWIDEKIRSFGYGHEYGHEIGMSCN